MRPILRSSLLQTLAAGVALVVGPAAGVAQACADGTISEITFDRQKPFPPEATSEEAGAGWLFRGLNSIHVRSLPSVIRWELLFTEGDCLEPALLEESARSLRSLPYIVEAQVTSEPLPDGTHRVNVRTIDAWALSLGIAFTVDNGFQITGVSFNARNLAGTGTQVGVFRNIYRERSRIGFLGRQPNLFGTRVDATVHGGTTRSGNYITQSLFRPYAGEIGANAFRQGAEVRDDYFLYSVDPALGFTQAYLRFEAEAYEATFQHRFGSSDGTRVIAGVGVSREVVRFPFGADGGKIVLDNDFADPVPAPPGVLDEIGSQANSFSTNRVSFTLGVRNLSFANLIGLDALRASQDVLRGADVTVTVAPSIPTGDDNGHDTFLRLQGAVGTRESSAYLRFDGDVQARYVHSVDGVGETGWRDFMYEASGNGYWTQAEGSRLFARVQLAAGYNMDRPFQLTLGGREAVRGYNEDAYAGARRILVTLEQRLALPALSTSFADVGVAVFADGGRMWAGDVPFGEDTRWKTGVGAGLRLGLPAGSPNVLRIDVGTPLTGDRSTRGTVFRIYAEFLGVLDRRSWPSQTARSRWYGIEPDLTTRPVNPLAGN